MTETRRRIKAYQEALPVLRERVAAVALLLVMSAAMMVSASFAWVTLSVSPELSVVSTTVTANGNLEIALVNKAGTEPGESAVGDSSATQGQSVTEANLTWGNLINLSDPSYGLDQLTLRPALLGNSSQLLEKPLKGVDYGSDGRTELYYNENYAYTSWVVPDESTGLDPYFGYFDTPQYGVRAISTTQVTYKNAGYQRFMELYSLATGTYGAVGDQYDAMLANDSYISALADLIGVFMTDKLNDSDSSISNDTIESVYLLMKDFEALLENFKEPMMHLANAQVFNSLDDAMAYYEANAYTSVDQFLQAYEENKLNASMSSLVKEYFRIRDNVDVALYGTEVTDTEGNTTHQNGIADFYNQVKANASNTVKMSSLNSIINSLVDISSCKIICEGKTYTVGTLGLSNATGLLGKDVEAVITKGTLKDFEQLTGYTMCATNVTVKAKYIVTVSMTAKTITTSAAEPYTIVTEQESTKSVQDGNKGSATITAEDTYGMAIDFWVRTNAENSYLVLEGNVLTTTSQVRATGIDLNGDTVDLYTVTITIPAEEGEEPFTQEVAAYYEGNDTTKPLRNADNHALIYEYDENGAVIPDENISNPIIRMVEVVEITGYEGENRVWEENALLDTSSTTQGSGSCYVFYSDDPAQQLSSLKLLSNLRVAFVDGTEGSATYGKKVAVAYLDTENYYAQDGKFIVPLKLVDDGSAYLVQNDSGDMAILPMERNKAMRLTAIVYLDGQSITNAEVLAANEIQGRLNIQFGSSVSLETMGDEKLEIATRSVSAQVKKSTDSSYASNGTPIEFSFDQATESNPMTVDVAVTVDGDAPATVTAFFMRRVNETQGSREDSFELKLDAATGKYVGSHTFTSPGNYVLRTVQLDGMDYDLPANDYPQVKITGFTINSVTCDKALSERAVTIMTGDRSVRSELSLKFSSDQTKTPNSVYLQFESEDGSLITANLSLDSSTQTWSGSANFTSSGVYTLKYAVMDGEYTELAESFQRVLTIYLGMSVRVRDTSEYNNVLYMGETITAPVYIEIYDNTGAELKYLQDVKLKYSRAGSILNGMDPSLKWNTSLDCYTGNLQIAQPGYYTFSSVTVGSSVLTVTTETPPTYMVTNPEPPAYVGLKMPNADYIIAKGADEESIVVSLSNAESALVRIGLYDADTDTSIYLGGIGLDADGKEVNQDWQTMTSNIQANEFAFSLKDLTTGQLRLGDWTVTRIEVANVYEQTTDEELVYYSEENPMVFTFEDVEEKTEQTPAVIDDETDEGATGGTTEATKGLEITLAEAERHVQIVNVKVTTSGAGQEIKYKEVLTKDMQNNDVYVPATLDSDGKLIAASKDSDGNYVDVCYYEFMEPATTRNGVTVTITDHMDRALQLPVDGITVTYYYDKKTSGTYGNYTSTNWPSQGDGIIDIYGDEEGEITKSGNSYILNSLDLTYAGEYKQYELMFHVNNGTEKGLEYKWDLTKGNISEDYATIALPTFKLWTSSPTVTVTGITPTSTSVNRHYSTANPTSTTQLVTGSFFSMDKYNAVVYVYFKYAEDYGSYDQEAFAPLIPKVELTISGMPDDFESASATFGDVQYDFAPKTLSVSKDIGSAKAGEFSYTVLVDHTYPVIYPAGTEYADEITVKYNSVEYKVDLSERVTISQPDAPIYLDYSIYGYDFNGTVPAMEISHDGNEIEVTLPTVDEWISRQTEYSYGDVTPDVTTSTVSYLTDSQKGIFVTTYYYDLYTRTKTSVTAATTTTVFDGTYAVTGWKIGGVVYAPGDKVTISAGQTATAVIEEVKDKRVVISTSTSTQTTVTLQDVYSSNTTALYKRSDATTVLYTSDKYPNGYTYVE